MTEFQDTPPKFIADTMLGKLARWLRLLGYDIVYPGIIDDDDLIERARDSERIIITRDTRLVEFHPPTPPFLVHSTDHWQQMRQVIRSFPIDFSKRAFSRCARCNVEIEEVRKRDVIDRLPPLVAQTQGQIFQCPSCKKLYWKASHIDHIRSLLKDKLGIDLE